MKVIRSENGFLIYQKIFKYLVSNSYTVVLWQVERLGTRKVFHTKLNGFNLKSKSLHFALPDHFEQVKGSPIYCYAESGQFMFKSSFKDVLPGILSVMTPEEIRVLEEEDVQMLNDRLGGNLISNPQIELLDDQSDKKKASSGRLRPRSLRDQSLIDEQINSLSLDEEDRLYADKRESPRSRPKEDKFVKVICEKNNEVHFLKLFDLSQGGIGFVTMEDHLFPKGSMIKVVGFEDFDLDDPLVGQVMSLRSIDDLGIEYKIGCKFEE